MRLFCGQTTIGGFQMEQAVTRSPELVVETGITRRRLFSSSGGLAAGTLVFGTPAIAALANTAHASSSRGCATPVGFMKLLVYIAEGPASAGSVRDVDAVLAFQQEIMGRDAATVATYIEQAKRFYLERFGLDFFGVDAPTPIGPWEIDGAVMRGGFLSPERGYTAHVVSEERVGPEGWMVRDGSFGVGFTEDIVLHGTWGAPAVSLRPPAPRSPSATTTSRSTDRARARARQARTMRS
jgi:hypothetical protein